VADLAVVIFTQPPVALYRDARPAGIDRAFRVLDSVGPVVSELMGDRGQTPHVIIRLDNGRGQLTGQVSSWQLAEAAVLEDGTEVWRGVVSRMVSGAVMTLELQAGAAGRRLTDPLPLRTTEDLGQYTEIVTLPRPLGRCTLHPVPFDGSGYMWLVADGLTRSIERVEMDQREITPKAVHQDTDASGHPVTVIETRQQVESATDLRVALDGLLHPLTGGPLDRPDRQLWYTLAVAGLDVAPADFADLAAWCETQGLVTGGVLDDHTVSVQSWLRMICAGAGLDWSSDRPGWALPWPPKEGEATVEEITRYLSPGLPLESDADALCTIVDVRYDRQLGEYRGSLRVRAPGAVELYGERLKSITAGWIQDARSALFYGRRYLAYYGRPLWRGEATAPADFAMVGDSVAVDHSHAPVSVAHVVRRARRADGSRLTLEGPAGPAPEVELDRTVAAVDPDRIEGPLYEYGAPLPTWRIVDEEGRPMPGARVTLDGGETRTADPFGVVQFDAAPGSHVLTVIAEGREPIEYPVVVT